MWRNNWCPTATQIAKNFNVVGTERKKNILIKDFLFSDFCLYEQRYSLSFCKNIEFRDLVFFFHDGKKLVMGENMSSINEE